MLLILVDLFLEQILDLVRFEYNLQINWKVFEIWCIDHCIDLILAAFFQLLLVWFALKQKAIWFALRLKNLIWTQLCAVACVHRFYKRLNTSPDHYTTWIRLLHACIYKWLHLHPSVLTTYSCIHLQLHAPLTIVLNY